MTINLNLLPWREELKEHQKREFLSMLGLGILAVLGLILFVHMIISRQISYQNDNNTFLKNQITLLDQQIAEIENLQKEKQQLLARMDIIQQLQTNRPEVVRLFDGIVRTVPEGLYLTSLTRTGPRILMEGKAESNTRVSTFMRNIEASHWLQHPALSLIQAEDQKQGEKQADHMIGFSLQAVQAVDEQENLNKLMREDKSLSENKEAPSVPSTSKTPNSSPK